MIKGKTHNISTCKHCGDICTDDHPIWEGNHFCCNGCEMVFRVLVEHDMQAYYLFEKTPGISQQAKHLNSYAYLDNAEVEKSILSFKENGISRLSLKLPQIHCSSCLWLLENLHRLNNAVYSSKVNFATKEAVIQYRSDDITLRGLVELLDRIGYPPELNFSLLKSDRKKISYNKRLIYQLGLAGFAFGNIMLLSFPEYLGFEKASINFFIGYINIALALPVLLFSGIDYLKSAFVSLKHKQLNLDFPIALGMLTLFLRSVYEILSQTGEGYLDSFSGFVFFLLIGKWFQNFTHKSLDFERNYQSYFPISSTVVNKGDLQSRSIDQICEGDILLIRNEEIIPVDSKIITGKAKIDYSFVTGESDQIRKKEGDDILAGGKLIGSSIEVECLKKVDQSYLTELWNNSIFKKEEDSETSKFVNKVSKYFTLSILLIALVTMIYWLSIDVSQAFRNFTSVLIVACPCALALSIPFTYGNILRLLAKKGWYLKSIKTIENIQDVDHIIFDKTGTLTDGSELSISYDGKPLSELQKRYVLSSCIHSSHPLSKKIVSHFAKLSILAIEKFEEVEGKGILSTIQGNKIKIGSAKFIFGVDDSFYSNGVFVEINEIYLGQFIFEHSFRQGMIQNIEALKNNYKLSVISGDSDDDKTRIRQIFGEDVKIFFEQSPQNKLDFVKDLQRKNNTVMMIGDGLNDAGALKQSNVGLVISENSNNFSPACDAILDADKFKFLAKYILYIKKAKQIIMFSFLLAFLYNFIGLLFAVSGNLSPVVAAILMPLSSITIIIFGVSLSTLKSIKINV